MEAFRAKGYEVLLLTDPIDEVWVDLVPAFDGRELASIAAGEMDLGGRDGDERTRTRAGSTRSWPGWRRRSRSEVKEVRLSHRLTTSPACLVGDAGDMTPTLEKMYRAMGQELPRVKRMLELNPTHPLVDRAARAHEPRAGRAGLGDTAKMLYGMALLAEGGELAEPAAFVSLLSRQLEKTLA